MLENNIVDYMIRECKANYNLDGAKLIKKSVEDKKVQFVFKRSDLKYMESDIKVYAKKYSNTWGVIQDYTINNAIYKYLGFGYGPELMR